MTIDEQIAKYRWYHSIELAPGVLTPGEKFDRIWDFIIGNMARIDFKNKSVLDIGCRDCLFSIMAERYGATHIAAIDNNLSLGAKHLALPMLESKVVMSERNLVDGVADLGLFDIVMMFGVLYHLRYPMLGLRNAVNATVGGGTLLIETAIYLGEPQHLPMLFCPWKEHQPYEPGSVSFFNRLGLVTCLLSMGCTLERCEELAGSDIGPVRRAFYCFRRTEETPEYLLKYWNGTHNEHT